MSGKAEGSFGLAAAPPFLVGRNAIAITGVFSGGLQTNCSGRSSACSNYESFHQVSNMRRDAEIPLVSDCQRYVTLLN